VGLLRMLNQFLTFSGSKIAVLSHLKLSESIKISPRNYKYGRCLVKTPIFDSENVRNGLSKLNNPQRHSQTVQISQAIIEL